MVNKKQIDQLILVILNRLPEVEAIYLFGSLANEMMSFNSDIDLAMLSATSIDAVQLWKLSQTLASSIGFEVDLVDLGQVSTVMQMQVIKARKRLYCTSFGYCEEFEDRVFSSYARLNEERSGILKDVAQGCKVYG